MLLCFIDFGVKLQAKGLSAKFITLSTILVPYKLNLNYGIYRLVLGLVILKMFVY
ncbi:hypothetical protein F383_15684 [Gossypium arboreum]|uniref:Uncharacterized protein n=1 Tax=Gossypium arboreum TaxID=29729 RepID=A0A0B0NKE0_GOSAR|nr:hypothetical protein F383_15684 [Gossypium arboreum]